MYRTGGPSTNSETVLSACTIEEKEAIRTNHPAAGTVDVHTPKTEVPGDGSHRVAPMGYQMEKATDISRDETAQSVVGPSSQSPSRSATEKHMGESEGAIGRVVGGPMPPSSHPSTADSNETINSSRPSFAESENADQENVSDKAAHSASRSSPPMSKTPRGED